MKKIDCKVHGEQEAVETDPILLRYMCKQCKKEVEELKARKK